MDSQRMENFCDEIYEKTRYTIPILGHQYGNDKIRQKYKHQKNDAHGGLLDPRQAEKCFVEIYETNKIYDADIGSSLRKT